MENGTYIKSNVIYTVNSLQNCDWHIVGVCYVDEMITNKVERVVSSLVVILAIVLAGTVFLGSVFSDLFSNRLQAWCVRWENSRETVPSLSIIR